MSRVDVVLDAHRQAGEFFEAAGVQSFVRMGGSGEAVLLVHGVPASSFVYRKVINELARRGLRGVAFDLPGLGLAERPKDYDYSVRGLGTFSTAAVEALGLDEFHLVVHDAGGPVGFELATALHDRVRSLTILDTVVSPSTTPFFGEIVARFTDRLPGWAQSAWLWRRLMLQIGVLDHASISDAEIDAHRLLALGNDAGGGYLRIMRAIGNKQGGPRDYTPVVDAAGNPYPVQVIWGARDPALPLRTHGMKALAATGLPSLAAVPARHYLQEDQAPAVAELVARLARAA